MVFAGPTGGHIFPAQSFSEEFNKRFPDSQITLVTCFRAKLLLDPMPSEIFHELCYFPEFGFSPGFSWKMVKPFFLMPYLFARSFFLLNRVKPHLCVGFGSFVSYPGMMMAHWLRIPTLIHEQNIIPGKATLWLAAHMDAVAESFEGTKFSRRPKRLFTVGLPLRSSMIEALKNSSMRRKPHRFTILVTGGSQGSQSLNTITADVFEELSDEERAKIAVIHITGSQDHGRISKQYQKLAFSCEVYPFCSSMHELFQKADLVISRAGANTLFELALFGLPALVIPYPYAGGHQRENAISFSERNGLLYHEQDSETKTWLRTHLKSFIERPESLDRMAKNMRTSARPHATGDLVEIAGKMIK